MLYFQPVRAGNFLTLPQAPDGPDSPARKSPSVGPQRIPRAMKLTIERAALLRSLNHVQSVVERRNTIPILSNVHLDARDGRLSLMATDMELAIIESVEAAVATEGATTAPAHTLYDIVRKLPDGAQIELDGSGEGDQVVLRQGRSRFALQNLPTADFPVLSAAGLPPRFPLPPPALRTLLQRTPSAIS